MRRGFTLLELMVVLFLVSLIAGLVFPRVVSFIPKEETFLAQAAAFIENARTLALSKHEAMLLVFSPEDRTIKILAVRDQQTRDLGKSLKVPAEIEIKADGLLALSQGRWGVLFLPNGASSGGEVEVIDRVHQRKILCRLARSQFLAEVRPE